VTSLRAMLTCIGVTKPNVSVLHDLLGFLGDRLPTDPDPNSPARVSLNDVVRGVKGKHVHLNVIRVGYDAIPAADQAAATERLDYAIYKIRNVYRPQNLGVGRVLRFSIAAADANGFDDIATQAEAGDLWKSFTVNNNGIDVFVVRNISASDFIGLSPVGGSCTKNSDDDGLLGGGNNRPYDGLARTFAHEVGHFLGLPHNHGGGSDCTSCPGTNAGKSNLMAQTRCTSCPGGAGLRDSTLLTNGQGATMRGHCSVQAGC
jgi:hypothetical protein